MKVKFIPAKNDFFIELEAETLDESTDLIRFGLNSTKKVLYKRTFLSNCDNSIRSYIAIGRRKQEENTIGL